MSEVRESVIKVSILTSCYNCASWLKPCIRSVMSQHYENWEWIIINDKSRDNSLSVLKKAAQKCNKIRVINNEKRLKCGGSYARALESATGDICCVIDADDELANKKAISILVDLYRQYPDISYIWTQFNFCDPDLRIVKRGSCRVPRNSMLEAGLRYTKDRHCFSHWRTFRTVLREKNATIFNPRLPAAVDKWMGYTLEELGRGGFFNKVLYMYRQRLGGLSFKGRKHWKRMLETFREKREKENIIPYPIIELHLK